MQIQLPHATEIGAALLGWRATNPAVDRMCIRYPEPHDALRHLALSLLIQEKIDPAIGFSKRRWRWRRKRRFCGMISRAPSTAQAGRRKRVPRSGRRSTSTSRSRMPGCYLPRSESNLGEDAAAESDYLTALRLDPHLAEAAFGLGLIYFQRRRFTESVKWLRQSIADGGHNMGLYVCLGQALFLLGDFAEAVAALEDRRALSGL